MKQNILTFILALSCSLPILAERLEYSNGYYEGDTHFSVWKERVVPHGYGIYFWENGDRYEGDWNNDNMHGKGTFYWINGNKYEGDVKGNQRTGYGIFYWANGAKYEGNFANGYRHGKGTMYYSDGGKYIGNWKDGKRDGEGVCYFIGGGIYEGNWYMDNMYGTGTYTFANSCKYVGKFKNSTFDGKGVFYWIDGNRFEGTFTRGSAEGKGTIFWKDGEVYETIWKNNKTEYDGHLLTCAGNVYDGNWQNENNVRFGYGILRDPNGQKIYDGEWENDKKNGYGVLFDAKGKQIYEGEWKEDEKNGWGILFKSNTERLVGWFKNNEFVGRTEEAPFRYFTMNYVIDAINSWQQKGEFEKTSDYQKRVTEQTRAKKIEQFTKEAEAAFITERTKNRTYKFELKKYDADNETYLVKCDDKELLVPVQIAEAQRFKQNFSNIVKRPEYFIDNDTIAISKITFDMYGTQFTYSNQASLNYSIAQIDYNFDPIEIETSNNGSAQKGSQNISQTKISVGKADVDTNIPQAKTLNESTFAFIIANENYKYEAAVPFAKNDGQIFSEYCQKTLGMPEKHVRLFTNATLNDFNKAVSDMKSLSQAYGGNLNLIFYYAGHGMPDEASKDGYLLPIDGYGSSVATGFSISKLYQELGKLNAEKTVVFLDACFSGTKRDDSMLAQNRGVRIVAKSGVTSGNTIAFTAATGNETAHQYNEKNHGMFTYFLLKKLQETQGNVTLGELYNYVSTNVKRTSAVEGTPQTPDKIPAANVESAWESWKLR